MRDLALQGDQYVIHNFAQTFPSSILKIIMGHNELCLLSGLRPGGGPSHLLEDYNMDRVVQEIAGEIKAISETTPLDLLSILRESLALAASYNLYDSIWENEKPPGLTEWSYFDISIAIGYFDGELGCCKAYNHNFKTGAAHAPGGRNVELRRVCSDVEGAWFEHVVAEASVVGCEMRSDCRTFWGNPNFFVLEGCYRYLEAWLDRDGLPPRSVAFPDDAEPMSIASELYEIVNSREQPRCKCQFAASMFH